MISSYAFISNFLDSLLIESYDISSAFLREKHGFMNQQDL